MRSRFRVCRFARLKSNVFTLYFAEKTRLAHWAIAAIAICTLLAALLGRQLFWLTLSPLIRAPRCTARNERLKHCKAKHLCKAFLQRIFISKKKRHFYILFSPHFSQGFMSHWQCSGRWRRWSMFCGVYSCVTHKCTKWINKTPAGKKHEKASNNVESVKIKDVWHVGPDVGRTGPG